MIQQWDIVTIVVVVGDYSGTIIHWIGLRENLQEAMVFTLEYEGVL